MTVRSRAGIVAVSLASAAAIVTSAVAPAAAAASERHGRIPVDHVVVLMQENRSFDDYLAQLHFEGQPRTAPEPRNASNPDPTNPGGPPIRAFHQPQLCEVADLNHSWTGTHDEIDGGRMDGFTAANVDPADPTGSRAMGYYTAGDLPFYNGLFSTFSIGDRYFASVPGPTFPNREYLLAGTSFGHIMNDLPATGLTGESVFNLLDQAGVTWKDYFSDTPSSFLFAYARTHAAGHVVPIGQYYADAKAGTLPQVAFVDPLFGGTKDTEQDEHPPANVQVGQQFASTIVNALFSSPEWRSSAFFETWDEHGGYYDNVAPPRAAIPDNIPPMLQPGDVNVPFNQYGVRLPVVVVSPFSRPHFVSHRVNDHTSILRFIETRFDLPTLTRRDASANPMLEFFNFDHASFKTPPHLPAATVDPVRAAAPVCTSPF